VLVTFRSGTTSTCYTVSAGEVCNCLQGIGRACSGSNREIKTVIVLRRIGVDLTASSSIVFDPTGLPNTPSFDVTVASTERGALRTTTNATGRPSVCSPGGAFREVPACP
jgi:hypothetical protein